ncbi:Phosphoglycolate phosphatase [Pelagimonas phthalicica]|uniref:Phosphoglycolate phosphatase n=1 Tax=Pelagimonas phthalicica TaxID=1037362 RepID=A0A238JG54_9RHOB|nr:HAD family hydrolase [Pelagimonas phthalicica]TDS92312.1 phosphoglycolate phosphatase [Pelagimonas phthalicica]SMX29373.1 Phosphoglycolate phosphatase [Pelagimonas phthalicica]
MTLRADAVLFDKDGTLFDFGATWDVWGGEMITFLAEGDAELEQAMAASARYDLAAKRFHPDSLVIAGTNREAAECLARVLPGRSLDEVEEILMRAAADAPLSQAVPLVPFLAQLAAMDLALGVMTNDTEYAARAHLQNAGVEGMFDFIAGFDSGFGAKPSPDPLLAYAISVNVDPGRCVMVGDSTHDLMAGRAAGMQTVGVLTGPAEAVELEPLADIVLPDIGGLTDWLLMR